MVIGILNFGEGLLPLTFLVMVTVASLGAIQIAAAQARLIGLLLLPIAYSRWLGAGLVAGSYIWFFSVQPGLFIPGLAGGELFTLFLIGFGLSVLISLGFVALAIVACAAMPRMLSRSCFSKPFMTEMTVTSAITPTAMPSIDTPEMKEMKPLRRVARPAALALLSARPPDPSPPVPLPIPPEPAPDLVAEAVAPAAAPAPERDEEEMREIEMGIEKFRRVVQLNPRNAHAWDALGTLYKSAGLYKDAILAYQQAISNDSSKSLYYHHLGLVYACEGRDEDAIGAFQQVLEIDPEYSLAHATLGGYYRKMGLEELAQKHIGKAMKNIFDSENEYNRACLEAICGNADQAIALLRVALKNKQTYVDWILRDPDLDFIRQDPRFKQLISDYTR